MNKQEMRNRFKKIRFEILDKGLKSKQIADRIMEMEVYKKSKVIALYYNLSCEVDTSILIKNSLTNGKIVVLPKVTERHGLEFYRVFSYEELNTKGILGIKEPEAKIENFVMKEQIDLIIVPGICFDKTGNRIGFGKGYYDKYMSGDFKATKIGICFDEQVLKNECIPVDEFDMKMNMVITDKLTY